MAGNDWLKGFDPLANLGRSSSSSGSAIDTGIKLGAAVAKAVLNGVGRHKHDQEAERARQQNEEILRAPPPVHGSAAWALPAEIDAAGYLRPPEAFDNPRSILLGVLKPPVGHVLGQLHWDGEGHLLSVAPTRSGKSTTQIVPNLLRYRGSCVVLDPKGELYRDTAAWRAANVGPVYRIAPFEPDTHAFNPLAMVTSLAEARSLADLMMPEDANASDFFRKDAIAFLAALILFVAERAPREYRTLAEVRRITAGSLTELRDVLEAMADSGVAAFANPATVVLGKNRDRALPTLRDTLNTELAIFDDPGIERAIRRADVDFHALKDRPATVYITVPFDKMQAYAPFLKVLLTSALEAMVQNPRLPDIPVLFVLDEFLSLGPFPRFRDAIRTHAGAGVRLWFFLQDVPTLEEHYPRSWKAFFNASVKTFFGVDETFTGQLVSDQLGEATVAWLSVSVGRNHSTSGQTFELPSNQAGGSVTETVNLTGRPLLTPAEVVRLLSIVHPDQTRDSIVLMRGVRPICARLVPWFIGPRLRERVRPVLPSSKP